MLKNRFSLLLSLLFGLAAMLPTSEAIGQPACSVEIQEKKDPNSPGTVYLRANPTGVPGFGYLWSTNETTRNIKVNTSGDYCVTITDSLGCTATECKEVRVQQDSCEVEIEIEQAGGGTGFIGWILSATGKGTKPFSFEWSTGDSTDQIRVSQRGRYCVTMTDDDGCQAVKCVNVDSSNVNCAVEITKIKGGIGTNLRATVLLANPKGQAPFKYLWSTGETTQRILTDSAGLYCVTITDTTGCSADTCIEVKDPNSGRCDVDIRKVELRLPGASSFLLLANARGAAPFEYEWSTGETGRAILVTQSGEYCVTITDVTGCMSEACITIDLKPGSSCDVDILQRNIPGPFGGNLLIAMPTGQAPFKFRWNTGDINRVIFANRPGEYCVTMVDASGCEAESCVKIGNVNPDSCGVTILKRPSSTASGQGYTLKAVANGTGPFTYSWSTGDTTESIRALQPGRYCVKIRDANGCTATSCIEIDLDICDVKIRASVDSINNSITLTAIGRGTPPFSFEWENGLRGPTIQVSKPGRYCVKMIDSTGCEAKACYEVKFNKDSCDVRIVTRRTSNSGVFLIAEPFGNGPFKYEWSTGESGKQIEVDKPGRYCVTIYTADGCKAEACVKYDGRVVIPDFTGGGVVSYSVYPNPVHDRVNLKRSEFSNDATVRIMRRDGQVSLQAQWPYGNPEMGLDVYHLMPGSYFIQVISKEQVTTLPFFKQ